MRLSIVTPTRNIARWLPQCLRSVRIQNDDAELVEHVVVDGASRDDSVPIARQFGARVVEVEHSGIFSKINHGIRNSSGNVIGYLGGDDLLLPGAVRTVNEWFESGRNPLLVGGVRWIDIHGRSRGDLRAPPTFMTSEIYTSLGWSCMQTTSVFVRREFMEVLGGYDESYVYSGDYELFARALSLSHFDRTSRSLSAWRLHHRNMSRSTGPAIDEELARIQAVFAPDSHARRSAYRLMLKIWLNGRSPKWFLYKKLPALRIPADKSD